MRLLIIIFISILASNVYSQSAPAYNDPSTDAMLFGDVKDAETGEHMPYVNIVVKGTTIGTTTNITGHYMFTDLPIGEITLIASYMGYKSVEKTIVTKDNEAQELFFLLEYDAIMTEQVVVSADRNAMSRSEAPVIVSSIAPKQLEAIETNTVADGLSFSPGLRVETNCQNCGYTQLRMNGLEGAYSQILVNSRPVFSGLAGVYGLEQIPTEMVERIEIVRGGGSSIFGGNAIGGTVNIITKDPINNTFNISAKSSAIGVGSSQTNNMAVDNRLSFNGALVTDDLKAGVFIFGLHQDRDHWDANSDGFSEIVELVNTSAGFQAYYKPTQKSRLSIEYHNLTEKRRGGDRFEYMPHDANIAEMLVHNNNSGGFTFETFMGGKKYNKLSLYASGQSVDRDSYYGAQKDPNAYGKTLGMTSVIGAQYVENIKSFLKAPGALTVGIENLNDKIKDTKIGHDTIDNRIVSDQIVNTIGSYAQYQMNYKKFKLLFGFRLDHYQISDLDSKHSDISGTAFNPRGNILYDLSKNVQLRVSYSTGYRAPQIFDEDLHIEASGVRRVEHRNSPDLTEERSQSFSASIRLDKNFGRWDVEFLAEGFYTELKNPFVTAFKDQGNGLVYSVRSNAEDGAKVYGSNLELTMAPSRRFFVQLGGTIQASEYESAQQWGEDSTSLSNQITRTPASYAYIILTYDPIKDLSLSFSGNYTGPMYVPHLAGGNREDGSTIQKEMLVKSPNFFVLNLKASYTLKLSLATKMEFFGGVKNILNSYQTDFDYGIDRDAGYVYGPMMPRTVYVGLKYMM
ncbi:MAG: TonB-dependent receptor [Bacteroidales bacterium]|nr:TonB-dependent receptor [Bacteroidales bacterium]